MCIRPFLGPGGGGSAVPPSRVLLPFRETPKGETRVRARRSRSNIFRDLVRDGSALSQSFIEFRLDRCLASLLYEEDQINSSVLKVPLTYKGLASDGRRDGRLRNGT